MKPKKIGRPATRKIGIMVRLSEYDRDNLMVETTRRLMDSPATVAALIIREYFAGKKEES